jgi:hypothetical protein
MRARFERRSEARSRPAQPHSTPMCCQQAAFAATLARIAAVAANEWRQRGDDV